MMTMDKQLWDALDNVEQSINKLVCIKEVLTLHSISNGDMVQILNAMVDEFSDNQKKVWLEVEKVWLEKDKHEEMNATHEDEYADLFKRWEYCYNRNIELEKKYDELYEKYDKLAYYDSYREDSGIMNTMNEPTCQSYMSGDTLYIGNTESMLLNNFDDKDGI